MKKLILLSLTFLTLSACDLWTVSPQPFPVWTPIPSRTPGIVTPTPVIIFPSFTPSAVTATSSGATGTPTATAPESATPTATLFQAVDVVILGCNTGIDFTHGMGEVTNAYVTIKNTGTQNLPDTCGLLRALDEDRVHPDKTRCVDNLPADHQVTLKLTVDSAYQEHTVIQVDATSSDRLLRRVDQPSCRDLDLLGPIPGDLGEVKPIGP